MLLVLLMFMALSFEFESLFGGSIGVIIFPDNGLFLFRLSSSGWCFILAVYS